MTRGSLSRRVMIAPSSVTDWRSLGVMRGDVLGYQRAKDQGGHLLPPCRDESVARSSARTSHPLRERPCGVGAEERSGRLLRFVHAPCTAQSEDALSRSLGLQLTLRE